MTKRADDAKPTEPKATVHDSDMVGVPTTPAPARDEHTGTGGHYEIRNGQRVLVHRTKRD